MPNWSTNTIAVKGKKADVINWLNAGLKEINKAENKDIKVSESMDTQTIADNLNETKLTLDSFNPMPKTFDEYDTTNTKRTYDEWLVRGFMSKYNRHSPLLDDETVRQAIADYYIEKGIVPKDLDNQEANKVRAEAARRKFPQYLGDYEKYCREYDEAAAYQKKTYGVVGWYNWGIRYRGTKWDANLNDWSVVSNNNGDELIVYVDCETAWSYPSGWLATMQTRYNTLSFFCRADEESGIYNGFLSARNMDEWIENDTDVWSNARNKVEAKYGADFDEDEKYEEIEELVNERNEKINNAFFEFVRGYQIED